MDRLETDPNEHVDIKSDMPKYDARIIPIRSPTSAIEQLVSSQEDETENEALNVEDISCDDWTSSDEDLIRYLRA